ncbi:MAG: tetratricopeptide repeat protein [Pseudoruegeria sp.]
MINTLHILKCAVAAILISLLCALSSVAQDSDLDLLFEQLAEADNTHWEDTESQIWQNWSRSGSDSMDLLLERGREAISVGDVTTAIGHLTALIDHAPEFAEGWNARATAYFHAGLYGPAVRDIQTTLSLNPRHFGAMSGLGMIMEQLGYPEDALIAYREALAIHPHRPDVITAVERLDKEVGGIDL